MIILTPMINQNDIQKGILAWLSLEATEKKTLRSINARCSNLWRQINNDGLEQFAKYNYFYPLLRSGVVEFYGHDNFSIAPSAAIYNEKCIAIYNASGKVEEHLQNLNIIKSLPGIYLLKFSNDLLSKLISIGLPVCSFKLRTLLTRISLSGAAKCWTDAYVIEQSDFNYFNGEWSDGQKRTDPGIYRRSAKTYAEHLYRIDIDSWKVIPGRDENFDAFNIALLLSKSIGKEKVHGIYYRKAECSLTISNNSFPLILERLLFFNTLLNPFDKCEIESRRYFLSQNDFQLLNHLTANNITINE